MPSLPRLLCGFPNPKRPGLFLAVAPAAFPRFAVPPSPNWVSKVAFAVLEFKGAVLSAVVGGILSVVHASEKEKKGVRNQRQTSNSYKP